MSNTPSTPPPAGRPTYWSTVEEYRQEPEYLERLGEEFYPEAKPERFFEMEGAEEKMSPMKRRTFLKLSGFAALAAMLQGCERPVQKILPYIHKPEEITYGTPNFYASAYTETGEGYGLLVKTREGRPIKLEGNPDHPVNMGKLDARAQASILDLYNPDRLRFPIRVNQNFQGEVGDGLQADANLRLESLDAEIGAAIRAARGKVVLLTPTIHGPSNDRLVADWLSQGDNFEHVVYDGAVPSEERRANALCFGEEITPRYLFANADVVVCLGGDPMGQGASPVEYQRDIVARHMPRTEGMSRIYCFEPTPSLTGMNVDYRYPVRPDQLVAIGLALASIVASGSQSPVAREAELTRLLAEYSPAKVAAASGVEEKELRRVADSLIAARGKSIIYTRSIAATGADALALHLVGNLLNELLGNYENTIDLWVSPSNQSRGSVEGILRLAREMNDGAVDVLVFQGTNPVYTLPASARFADGLRKVKLVVSLDRMMNETAALSHIAIPGVHPLESWGDAEPQQGLLTIQQPAIRTLFGELAANPTYRTRGWQESVMAFVTAAGAETFRRRPGAEKVRQLVREGATTDTLGITQPLGFTLSATMSTTETLAVAQSARELPISWYEYVVETWETQIFESGGFATRDFQAFWQSAVQKGIVDVTGGRRPGPFRLRPFRAQALASIRPAQPATGRVLVTYRNQYHGNGDTMGNPFLLELPEPVSKICWDNYAAISPLLADELGLRDGDHVTLKTSNGSIEIPVYIQPGSHKDVVAVMLGWGRNTYGGVGDEIGVNVMPLLGLNAEGTGIVYSGVAVEIAASRGRTRLANAQSHNYLFSPSYGPFAVNEQKAGPIPENAQLNEDGLPVYDRPIIGQTTWNEWKKDPAIAYPNYEPQNHRNPTMWERSHKYVGHHWGMLVDLTACTGCGACVIACQVENNIPVVGKDEVIRGREMHWLRIDRYYRGDLAYPEMVNQPMLCQHCDNAPCETVCPVIATSHNDEGLNVMTYNRCVGTRYCSNNCPYKVRRFNFWQYTDYRTGPHDNVKRVAPLEMVLNPDVTTRSRGVMEKCTFCIHRIRYAKDKARESGEPLKDGALQTACQQTCPSNAIIFGDRNDPNAKVALGWRDPRNFGLLDDLNTDPSIRYYTIVKNRDEPAPYRTEFQATRMRKKKKGDAHGAGKDHGDDHSHGASNDAKDPHGSNAGAHSH